MIFISWVCDNPLIHAVVSFVLTSYLSLIISHLLRLPAFDDSGRGRHHFAIPIPVATHLPAHCFCTTASPPGCSCAVPHWYPAQRRSSAIRSPPPTRGTELNRDLMCNASVVSCVDTPVGISACRHFTFILKDLICRLERSLSSLPVPSVLHARQFALCLRHVKLTWHGSLSRIKSCTQDHFMLHEYPTEASLKSLCPRKEAVERQLRAGGMRAKM